MIVLAKVCKGVDTILKDYEGSYSKKSNISREILTFIFVGATCLFLDDVFETIRFSATE